MSTSLGTAFEHRVRDRLRACGYTVIRAAASKSCVDLVAVRSDRVLLVQCKRHSIPRTAEWNALYDLAGNLCVPVLASMPGRTGVKFFRLAGRKSGVRGVVSPLVPLEPGIAWAIAEPRQD